MRWDAKRLCSRRSTIFTDTDSQRPLPCNESATISRVTDMPSSRCLFRLVPSEPPTEETGFSLLPTVRSCSAMGASLENAGDEKRFPNLETITAREYLLLTPTAVMTEEPPEKMRERAEKNGYKNGTKYGSLESQIKYDPKFADLLPTPRANKVDDCNLDNPGVANRNKANSEEEVAKMMQSGMLPTPTVNDQINQTLPPSQAKRNDSIVKRIINAGLRDSEDGTPSRLSPLFTEEMMGFPLMWTALPFLSQNGEQSPSRPTATR